DFHQTGAITTLHRLPSEARNESAAADLQRLEAEIRHHASARPIALVLPCLYDELRDIALKGIVETLRGVGYLHQVVVSVDGAESRDEFDEMRAAFDGIRTLDGRGAVLVWNDGPRIRAIDSRLRAEGLDAGERGKGRATWLAFGYVLATAEAHVVAVHDCDIRNYPRELLARLCYPTVHPNLNYEYAKGYYGRVTDRLYGRVTRLFMTPLLRAM